MCLPNLRSKLIKNFSSRLSLCRRRSAAAPHTHTQRCTLKQFSFHEKRKWNAGKPHDFAFASCTVMNFVIISSNIHHQDPAHTHTRRDWLTICGVFCAGMHFSRKGACISHNYRDITNVCILKFEWTQFNSLTTQLINKIYWKICASSNLSAELRLNDNTSTTTTN